MIVERGRVPDSIDAATHHGVCWQAASGRFLLDVPGVARYLVEGGARVTVEPAVDASPAEVERYLATSPRAALHLQRGEPVLHAAWLRNPSSNGAVVIAGDSATGKSTLAAALWQRGWSVGADDVTPVTMSGEGAAFVRPTSSTLVLWPGMSEHFASATTPYGPDGTRRAIDTGDGATAPTAVEAVWWLGHHNGPAVASTPLRGAGRFDAVTRMAFNSRLADALIDRGAFLRTAAGLVSAPMTRLLVPRGREFIDAAADLVAG